MLNQKRRNTTTILIVIIRYSRLVPAVVAKAGTSLGLSVLETYLTGYNI